MAKDSLASGAYSAQFSGGRAKPGEPVEFHGTVATDDVVIDNSALFYREEEREPATLEELAALYEPMNDRVLLRRVVDAKRDNLVVLPDAFVLESHIGIVIAAGEKVQNLKLGDKVRVGHYNVEDIEHQGEKLMLVSAADVRLKIKG